jgi:hypothetical protein
VSLIYCSVSPDEGCFTRIGISTATKLFSSFPITLKYTLPYGSTLTQPANEIIPEHLFPVRIVTPTDPVTASGSDVDLTADTFSIVVLVGNVTANATAAKATPNITLGAGDDPVILVPTGDVQSLDTILTVSPYTTDDKLWAIIGRVLREQTWHQQQS